jgi:hypothetical protein
MGAFAPLAFITVCLRMYTRWRFAKIGADDIAVLVGFVLYMGLIVATVYGGFSYNTSIPTSSSNRA